MLRRRRRTDRTTGTTGTRGPQAENRDVCGLRTCKNITATWAQTTTFMRNQRKATDEHMGTANAKPEAKSLLHNQDKGEREKILAGIQKRKSITRASMGEKAHAN